jgi:hypothetical protein
VQTFQANDKKIGHKLDRGTQDYIQFAIEFQFYIRVPIVFDLPTYDYNLVTS